MEAGPERWARIEAVLDQALELPPADRGAHVARACTGDPGLERDVLALLEADARAGSFLTPLSGADVGALLGRPGADETPAAMVGHVVGAYRLTALIGEGGMGTVYDAERADGQFDQHVAVKLMKWSGATAEAQHRFLRERQILAGLAHPHIARLLDGGVTDDGVPYFVMERVVPGQALTTYCEEAALDVAERLHLLLQACDAVQYAHAALVVHRDLKPSNIVIDAAGAVKLLDFGIAKLLADDESPFVTRTDGRPMTPAFAAPEQVEGGPITIATDVYALGVVLYVVLTGRLPYDVGTGGVADWARAVLETAPRRPSAVVTEPRTVARLRGDLDCIVLKSLEKEPGRRYVSVDALATDIRRHLAGLPVEAHDASRWYRARKFVGRNRLLVGGVAATVVALAAGLGATAWQARIARAETRRAEAVQGFLVSVFQQADPDQAKGRELTAKAILDAGTDRIEREFAAQPDVRYALWDVVHDLYQKLGDYASGVTASRHQVEAALAAFGPDSFEHGRALRRLASALAEVEDTAAAAEPLARALPIIRRTAGDQSDEMIEGLNTQAIVLLADGKRQAGIDAHRRAAEIARMVYGPDTEATARVENDLVVALGDGDEALALAHHVSSVYRATHGGESYMYSIALYNEGNQLYTSGRWTDAARVFAELMPIQERLLGVQHTKTVLTYRQLARLAAASGDFDRARDLMGRALTALEAEFGASSVAVALAQGQLANIERMSGRYDAGVTVGQRAADTLRRSSDTPSNLALALNSLASTYLARGDAAPALTLAREAVTISEGSDQRWLGANLAQLGAALVAHRERAAAVPVLRRAIETLRGSGQGQSVACADALRWLADAGGVSTPAGERETLYQESLALFAAVAPAEQADGLDARLAYGRFLVDAGRPAAAAAQAGRVRDALRSSTGIAPARRQALETAARALGAL